MAVEFTCDNCGKKIMVTPSEAKRRKGCSPSCARILYKKRLKENGEKHFNWKSGRSISGAGYVLVRQPDHHRARCGYVFEHIVIAEKKIGRKLKSNEDVHHIDRNKQNNDPENLMVLDHKEHSLIHNKRTGKTLNCPVCDKEFYCKLHELKNPRFCSKACFHEHKKKVKISNDEWVELFEKYTITQLSKMYGLTTGTLSEKKKRLFKNR